MDTKEELLKWKEKRQTEIAEEKANKKQRPPFVVGKFKLGEDKLELQTIEKHSKKGKKRTLRRAKKLSKLNVKTQNQSILVPKNMSHQTCLLPLKTLIFLVNLHQATVLLKFKSLVMNTSQ